MSGLKQDQNSLQQRRCGNDQSRHWCVSKCLIHWCFLDKLSKTLCSFGRLTIVSNCFMKGRLKWCLEVRIWHVYEGVKWIGNLQTEYIRMLCAVIYLLRYFTKQLPSSLPWQQENALKWSNHFQGHDIFLFWQACLVPWVEYSSVDAEMPRVCRRIHLFLTLCFFFTLQHAQCTSTLSWIWMYRLIKYSVQSLKQKIKCTGISINFEEQAFVKISLHKGQKQESFLMVWCVIFLWHIILCLAIMHIVLSLFDIDRRSIPFFFKWPLFPVFFILPFLKRCICCHFSFESILMYWWRAADLLAR